MHPQLPGVLMMAIMGMFHTPQTTTPSPTVDPLRVLLSNVSEAVNSTEQPWLSNFTVELLNATELVPLVRGSLLDDLTQSASNDDNYTAPFQLTAKYVPLWNSSQVGKLLSTEHFNRRLVGPLKVGTPGVVYQMLFDNGRWNESMLFASTVNFPGVKWYHYSKDSSTYSSILTNKKVENASGIFIQSDEKREDINDLFWVSKVHSFRQNFAVLESEKEDEEIATLFKVLPADGILSLSSAPKLKGSFPSFLNASLAEMRDQVVTFHVMPATNYTDKEQTAILSFGDLDPVHCNKDNWTVVPQLNSNNWSFHLNALGFSFGRLLPNNSVLGVFQQVTKSQKLEMRLGNSTGNSVETNKANDYNSGFLTKTIVEGQSKHVQTLSKNPNGLAEGNYAWMQLPSLRRISQTAAVVIAEGLSRAPAEHVKFIADSLGATKNTSDLGEELYSMPCAQTIQNRDLLLTFYLDEGKTIVLRFEDLLMQDPIDPSNCILIFVESNEVNVGYEWALGGHFFNNHCAMLDYKNHKVGFTFVMPPVAAV